uniref:Uncharacterized protein n=1 Tax=Ascaris lumbricoides TaxID=6252 RepID=A0A0M3IJ36_ASCLU
MDNARKFVHNGFANEEIYGRLADSVFGRTESEAVHNKLVPSGPELRTPLNIAENNSTPFTGFVSAQHKQKRSSAGGSDSILKMAEITYHFCNWSLGKDHIG